MTIIDRFIIAEPSHRETRLTIEEGAVVTNVLTFARSERETFDGNANPAVNYVDVTFTLPGVGQSWISMSQGFGTTVHHVTMRGDHTMLAPRV
jgi:hypothetical protein